MVEDIVDKDGDLVIVTLEKTKTKNTTHSDEKNGGFVLLFHIVILSYQ